MATKFLGGSRQKDKGFKEQRVLTRQVERDYLGNTRWIRKETLGLMVLEDSEASSAPQERWGSKRKGERVSMDQLYLQMQWQNTSCPHNRLGDFFFNINPFPFEFPPLSQIQVLTEK